MNIEGHYSRTFKEGDYPDYIQIKKYEDTVLNEVWKKILNPIVKKLKDELIINKKNLKPNKIKILLKSIK